jgi:hypothetical protein
MFIMRNRPYTTSFLIFIFLVLPYKIAYADFLAKVTWGFGNDRINIYEGRGKTQSIALKNAESICLTAQVIKEYKFYCLNTPINVHYTQYEACGEFWTKWRTAFTAPGNPCPSGCSRGKEIDSQTTIRSWNLHQRTKFQCDRIIN